MLFLQVDIKKDEHWTPQENPQQAFQFERPNNNNCKCKYIDISNNSSNNSSNKGFILRYLLNDFTTKLPFLDLRNMASKF